MPLLNLNAIQISSEDPEKVFEEIGVPNRGNHGSVVKARNVQTNEIVAVKKILLKDESELSDIVNEIVLLSKCNHPNIVKYYGTYKSLSHLWIIMEYCEGGSLDLIYKVLHHPLPESLIAFVCHEVLCGLHYLHSQHRLHRDIKGSNILLTERGEVKLADFGVSTELAHSFSRRNTCTGTVLWMAPEAIQQIDYDDRADIWSLGITLIEMAENAPPRIDIPVPEVIFTIAWQEPPSLKHKEDWSPLMNIFVKRLLTKDPHFRPSAAMLLNDPFVQSDKIGTQAELSEVIHQVMERLVQLDSDHIRRQDFSSDDSTGTFVARRHESSLSSESSSSLTTTTTTTSTASHRSSSSSSNSMHDEEEQEEEEQEESTKEIEMDELQESNEVDGNHIKKDEKFNFTNLQKVNTQITNGKDTNREEVQLNRIQERSTPINRKGREKKDSTQIHDNDVGNIVAMNNSNNKNSNINKKKDNKKDLQKALARIAKKEEKHLFTTPKHLQTQENQIEQQQVSDKRQRQQQQQQEVELMTETVNLPSQNMQDVNATSFPQFPFLHASDFSLEALAEMCLADRLKQTDNQVAQSICDQLELDVKEGQLDLTPDTRFNKPVKLLHVTRALQANHAYYQQIPHEYKMNKEEALKTNQIRMAHGSMLRTIFNF